MIPFIGWIINTLRILQGVCKLMSTTVCVCVCVCI